MSCCVGDKITESLLIPTHGKVITTSVGVMQSLVSDTAREVMMRPKLFSVKISLVAPPVIVIQEEESKYCTHANNDIMGVPKLRTTIPENSWYR